jgi:hypothetical protein
MSSAGEIRSIYDLDNGRITKHMPQQLENSIRYRPSTENMMDTYDLDNGRILLPRRKELDRAQISQDLDAIRGFADDHSNGDLSC